MRKAHTYCVFPPQWRPRGPALIVVRREGSFTQVEATFLELGTRRFRTIAQLESFLRKRSFRRLG